MGNQLRLFRRADVEEVEAGWLCERFGAPFELAEQLGMDREPVRDGEQLVVDLRLVGGERYALLTRASVIKLAESLDASQVISL